MQSVENFVQSLNKVGGSHDGLGNLQQNRRNVGFFLAGVEQIDILRADRDLLRDSLQNREFLASQNAFGRGGPVGI